MDLYAYASIGALEGIAKENGISVPRLRGYRLMSQEEPVTKEILEELIEDDARWECEQWCCSHFFERDYVEYSSRTDKIRKHVRKSVRAEIFRFIDQLPLNMDVEVNGIKYKLVHGSPVENYEDFGWNRRQYPTVRDFAVWNRWDECQYVPEGYVMIFGHTPTHYFRSISPLEIWTNGEAIGIDCGCGFLDGRLACIRLEDMKVFYSVD